MNSSRRIRHLSTARGVGVVAITALALIGSGCSSDPVEIPSVLVDGESGGKDGSKADPIDFGAKPLWDKTSLNDFGRDDSGFEESRVIGDKVVYNRVDEEYDGHLTIADAESGKTKWKLADDGRIKGGDGMRAGFVEIHPLGGSADATELILEYRKDTTLANGSEGEESGVAAVSIKDGHLLWSVSIATGPRPSHNVYIDYSSSEYITAELATFDDETDTNDLFVVSAEKREVLWQKDGRSPTGIAGDTVLAENSDPDAEEVDLLAFKAGNGEKRWDVDKGKDPEVLATTGGSVIASASGAVAVIDSDSGDTRTKLSVSATVCHRDGKSTLACQSQDDERPKSAIQVIELSGDSATAAPVPDSDDVLLLGIHDGGIFTEDRGDSANVYRVRDAAGDSLADELPGRLIDISGDFAVFSHSTAFDNDRLRVHEVRA